MEPIMIIDEPELPNFKIAEQNKNRYRKNKKNNK